MPRSDCYEKQTVHFRRSVEIVSIFFCVPHQARSARELSASSLLRTTGRTSFLKPRVQPSVDPFKHGIGPFPGEKNRNKKYTRAFYIATFDNYSRIVTVICLFRFTNAILSHGGGYFRQQVTLHTKQSWMCLSWHVFIFPKAAEFANELRILSEVESC